MAAARVVDMPHSMKHIMVVNRPMSMVVFLPMRSDAQPQKMAVELCDMEKVAPIRPAHFAISSFLIPKLWTISGRYGKTDVRARGSANLTTAMELSVTM
jgi:hypothetical protein